MSFFMHKVTAVKNFLAGKLREEKGEANIIAIILIIVVVIALAVIFRDQITGIVTNLFKQITETLEGF